jgi:peptide/nickel transport system permease protein
VLGLLSFVLRRLGLAIFVLLGVAIITFVLSHSISSNPIVAWLGRAASIHPELAAAYAEKYHLSEPMHVQFWYYILGLLQGDLGYSVFKGKPVADAIWETLPFTLQIAVFAILFTLVIGIPLGVLAGRYHGKAADYGIRGFYLAGVSSPAFLVALFLLIVLTYSLRLLPSGGALSPGVSAPESRTGFIILDSLLEGNWATFGDSLAHIFMPSMALALGVFGYVTRVLRASILEVMRTNYIRTARAKGLDENVVFFKHAFRNAMIPIVTLASLIVTWLVTGTLFAETIFTYPGVGQYMVLALASLDYPSILGITLVFAVIIVFSNLVADILYAVVDPEIRLR